MPIPLVMPRHVRVRLLLALSIAAIAGAVWLASDSQRTAANRGFAEANAADSMIRAMLVQQSELRDYLTGRDSNAFADYQAARQDYEAAADRARDFTSGGEARLLQEQLRLAGEWHRDADVILADDSPAQARPVLEHLEGLMGRIVRANGELRVALTEKRESKQRAARLLAVGLIVLLGGTFAVFGYVFFERRARHDDRRRGEHGRFVETLQLARTETEAYTVVKRYLERLVGAGVATVLNRNNSANRLEASMSVEGSPLAETLDGADPESCMAIRGGRIHQASGDEDLLACEVCGQLGRTTCVPSLVGGEVIGSVLVQHERPLGRSEAEHLAGSINEAAPIIANLRTLAIAELRAATDVLTGLPNNRSVHETLKRMAAQAGRDLTPLSAVLFDLDHFKQINDAYGHSKGDEVLAIVGATVAVEVRASDFVGRYGGEEFLVLLPNTDKAGAIEVAEKLRQALERIDVAEIGANISGSFGVAVLPDDAPEPDQLIRMADRAMYMAKSRGRNRVEAAGEAPAPAPRLG